METAGGSFDLLVVSNGHGEDAIGALLASEIARRHPQLRIGAVALVGMGHAYDARGVPVIFRSRPMPSEGFGWQQPLLFLKDLAAGFLSLSAAQLDTLRRLRPRVRHLLLVGDIYPVLMTQAYRVPKLFVATARSDYIAPHLKIEVRILARACDLVLARDHRTAMSLGKGGVRATSVGNFMMDMVQPRGLALGLSEGAPVLALLPGSRRDFPDNLAALAAVVRQVRRRRPQVQAVAALAAPVPPERVPPGWRLQEATEADRLQGIDAWLLEAPRSGVPDDGQAARIALTLAGFPDLLHRATLVLGLAGTANEQAAGLGKVVVSFPRQGVQYTLRFAARQQRLLGDALVLCGTPERAAQEALRLLDAPDERQRRGAVGRQRMGLPGAAERAMPLIERVLGLCATCPHPEVEPGPEGAPEAPRPGDPGEAGGPPGR